MTFSHLVLLIILVATSTNCTNCILGATFFTERVVNVWNSLPPSVNFSSLSTFKRTIYEVDFCRIFSFLILICYLHLSAVYFSFYTVFIVLRAAVRAPVSLAVLLGFTCLVAFVYFVYFYEQINDLLIDKGFLQEPLEVGITFRTL